MKSIQLFLCTLVTILFIAGCTTETNSSTENGNPPNPEPATTHPDSLIEKVPGPEGKGELHKARLDLALVASHEEECVIQEDRIVSFKKMVSWIKDFGRHSSNFTNVAWPSHFHLPMPIFRSMSWVEQKPGFRVYLSFCPPQEENGKYVPMLMVSNLDGTCLSYLEDHTSMVSTFFTSLAPESPYSPCYHICGHVEGCVYLNDAITYSDNWKSYWGVDLENTNYNGPNGQTYQIPLAFNYNSSSFREHINTNADSLFVYFGLEQDENNENNWFLKLIFASDKDPIDANRVPFVDFAAPCPQNCGKIDTVLKGKKGNS